MESVIGWMTSILRSLGSVVVIGIGSMAVYLYMNQRSLIYPSNMPDGSREQVDDPKKFGLGFEELFIESPKKEGADGTLKLHAYFVRSDDLAKRKKAVTILYCHANAGNMGHRLPIVKLLHQQFECNVLIFSYRGYGKSEGDADEAGMKLDSMTVARELFKRTDIDTNRVILFGQSIGGAVAINLASKPDFNFKALVVENTFLTLDKLIPHVMPIAKYVTFLCTEKWHSEVAIKQVNPQLPFLFLSSSKDELVPFEHQKQLFELAPMISKKFCVIEGAGHNDPVMYEAYWTNFADFWKANILSKL